MKKIFLFLLMLNLQFVICNLNSFAQNYFQQEVNYHIDVYLDDKKNELTATENIEYINNSPNELTFIYMHLWPNAYKDNTTALAKQILESGNTEFFFSTDKQRGYIDQLDFNVNKQSVRIEYDSVNIDICKIILNQPLKSGEKISISTPFHVKIPEGIFPDWDTWGNPIRLHNGIRNRQYMT